MLTKKQIQNWKQAIQAAIEEHAKRYIAEEEEKAEHRKKNDKLTNQYDVVPGFKNTIKISKR